LIGVTNITPVPGTTMGPPDDKLYAVDPVDEEIINPSAQYVFIRLPSYSALILIMEVESFLVKRNSLSA